MLLQVLKIFMLSRVTPKAFKALPGLTTEAAVVDEAMKQSNLYTVHEMILLKWLTFHFNKQNPHNARRVTVECPCTHTHALTRMM